MDLNTDNSTPTDNDETQNYYNSTSDATVMAICTDSTRHGSAIYSDSCVKLVADRKDPGDPYKGLDIVIQRVDPTVVIVSSVQKKLLTYLEKRFTIRILDLSRKSVTRSPSQTFDTTQRSTSSSQNQSKRLRVDQSQEAASVHTLPISDDQTQTYVPVRQDIRVESSMSASSEGSFTLVIAPNIWFSMSRGLQKLIDSELVESKGFVEPEEKSFFVTSKVDKSADVCAIRAISAIENYFNYTLILLPRSLTQGADRVITSQQSRKTLGTQQDSNNLMPIVDLRYVDPGPILSINKSTFNSLNIFSNQGKRSEQLRNMDAVDDSTSDSVISLYELLNECQSPQGRKQLKTIMLWPLQDLDELRHRHDAVEFLLQPENRLFREQLAIQLKNVVPLANLLTKLSHSVCSDQDITKIYKILWSFIAVIDLIKAKTDHGIEIFHRIVKLDSVELRETIDSILQIVDFEGSKREKRIQVSDGIDPGVDEKKEVVRNLSKFCDEVAAAETAKYKEILNKTCRVFYIPRIGFLNSVEFTTTSELQRISSNKEFDILLHTENSVYFKTRRMEDLDRNAGDIACDLIDVQESVVMNLQSEVLKHSETILQLMELCGELDCFISFAVVSFQRGYTRPEFVTTEDELDIIDLYHPLCCVKTNMVPNSVRFYKESSERRIKVMIITGPNSCGKTTYMKATCLTIYMAHIGCFVPANRAMLPPFDAILTRMHSGNSISTGLSSFATDLHQINFALSKATDRSFVAIDEFGKGTQARDGFHLLKGVVSYFGSKARTSPYVMVTTHYNRLIDHLHIYSEYILYKTFKVSKDASDGNIIYEFQIIDGVSEASFADKVATKAGVPVNIIDRANQIRDHITEGRVMRPRPPNAA